MASSDDPNPRKTTESNSEEERIRTYLTGWDDFEEVEYIIGPYVEKLIKKAFQHHNSGYGSAAEVLSAYKFLTVLLEKLTKGKKMLLVPTYVAEYFYRAAMLQKLLMLRGFAAMRRGIHGFTLLAMNAENLNWISEQLDKENFSEERIEINKQYVTKLDNWVAEHGQEVVNVVSEQKKARLELLLGGEYQLVENDFRANIKKFEELKCIISEEERHLESLGDSAATYIGTLLNIQRNSTILSDKFWELLRHEKKDVKKALATEWSRLSVRMTVAAKEDKERLAEA